MHSFSAPLRRCLTTAMLGWLFVTEGCDIGPRGPVTFTGMVIDSLTSEPVPGVLATFGADSATTDGSGTFYLHTVARTDSLSLLADPFYFPYHQTLTVPAFPPDQPMRVLLRRSLPFIQPMTLGPGGVVTATIIDLKGVRELRLNDSLTWMTFQDDTIIQSSPIYGTSWTWQQLDSLTLQVTVHIPSTGVTRIDWHLLTVTGASNWLLCMNPRQFVCGNVNVTSRASQRVRVHSTLGHRPVD